MTDDQGKTGMVIFSDDAASGIDSVRTELAGDVLEVPVTEGVFLAVWFGRPYDEDNGPRIVAFRRHGEWKPYERWPWLTQLCPDRVRRSIGSGPMAQPTPASK